MSLNKYLNEQQSFQKNFFDVNKLTDEQKVSKIKETILCIHKELSEVLDTFNWKTHRKEDKFISKNNTLEEIIDCFKYLLNLCVILDVNSEEIEQEFFRKSRVVRQRYQQEILSNIQPSDKVCAIDLDDTLSNSEEYFVITYNDANNTEYRTKKEIKDNISLKEYEDFKHFFRESGVKVNIQPKEHAKKLCNFLKEQGYKIVIISARPYDKYFRIFPDTLQWLEQNEIKFDAIYFEKEKHLKIIKQLPQLSFIIEDDVENAEQIAKAGYNVYLLNNQIDKSISNVTVVDSLSNIITDLCKTTI